MSDPLVSVDHPELQLRPGPGPVPDRRCGPRPTRNLEIIVVDDCSTDDSVRGRASPSASGWSAPRSTAARRWRATSGRPTAAARSCSSSTPTWRPSPTRSPTRCALLQSRPGARRGLRQLRSGAADPRQPARGVPLPAAVVLADRRRGPDHHPLHGAAGHAGRGLRRDRAVQPPAAGDRERRLRPPARAAVPDPADPGGARRARPRPRSAGAGAQGVHPDHAAHPDVRQQARLPRRAEQRAAGLGQRRRPARGADAGAARCSSVRSWPLVPLGFFAACIGCDLADVPVRRGPSAARCFLVYFVAMHCLPQPGHGHRRVPSVCSAGSPPRRFRRLYDQPAEVA